MTTHPDWLLEKIEKFSKIGFFDSNSESITTIAQRIVEESEYSYFGNILKLEHEPLLDQILLSYDRKKVWHVEDWMVFGSSSTFENNFYYAVFEKLSNISNGNFMPEKVKIEECGYCDGKDKRLSLAFQLDKKEFDLTFCIDGEALILSFLEELNEILESKGLTYRYIFDAYGAGFIFWLDKKQYDYLSHNLKWNFDSNRYYWLENAQFYRDKQDQVNALRYFEKALHYNGDSFVCSEFGCFLDSVNEDQKAVEVYKKGIENLKALIVLDQKQQWWLNSLESNLERIEEKNRY